MSRSRLPLKRLLRSASQRIWDQGWKQRPLRQKLAIGVWLSVVPITLTATAVGFRHMKTIATANAHQELLWEAEVTGDSFEQWAKTHIKSMNFLAESDSIRSFDRRKAAETLQEAENNFPQYSFWLTKRDGQILFKTSNQVAGSPTSGKPNNSVEARALAGIANSGFTNTHSQQPSCYITSVPVYANPGGKPSPGNSNQPIAALSSCISIADLGPSTGIDKFRLKIPSQIHGAGPGNYTNYINFLRNKPAGAAIFLVSKPGRLLLIESKGYDNHERDAMLNPDTSMTSPWGPFISYALGVQKPYQSKVLRLNGRDYLVAVKITGSDHRGVAMMDSQTATSDIRNLFRWLLLSELVAIAIGSLVVYRICATLSQPIDQAGAVLAQISRGDFSQTLPKSDGDIGQLFAYVNAASTRLQKYLSESKAHAVTDAQLEQARLIQKDFLVQKLPNDETVELAADFQPAYQIGADWYDALQINGNTIVVVADVCDKGIPSALYMSVFRSLLRLSLQKELSADDAQSDPSAALCRAITTTNRYMAETHGGTAMFATAFVGVYLPQQQLLTYVVAGHESPLVFHQGQVIPLALGGPVLGVFAESQFEPGHIQLQRGDYLLAFSDGLPDARNAAGESFGMERTVALFQHLATQGPTAVGLLEAVKSEALAHMAVSDQFDDLTLLTMRIKGSA